MVHESFSHAQITEQVNKISRSSILKNSPVLRQFLHFVVDETLEGNGGRIKEYTIGTQVLGRKSDFDPQLDAIVRIHAGRLRRALNEFYSSEGKGDAMRISIPKGGYAPNFTHNGLQERVNQSKPASITERGENPALAVMPFRNISQDASYDFFCQELGEFVSTELARFQELSLVSYSSCANAAGKTMDICEMGSLLGAEYILTGSIFIDHENLRMLLQLSRSDSGKQLWSHTFTSQVLATQLFQIQEEIVNLIVGSLGGYYGAIHRDVAEGWCNTKDRARYETLFWYDQWVKNIDCNTFDHACEVLEDTIRKDPTNVLALAVLCEIYAAGTVMKFIRIDNQLEMAIQFSKKAVNLDPLSQHAHQAVAVSNLINRNRAETIAAAERCMALNPRAATYAAGVGGILIFAGEFEKGAKVLRESLSLNPFFPWMHALAFSLYHYYKSEFESSKVWAEKMEMPGIPWSPMLRAACYAQLGQPEAAVNALNDLLVLVPEISTLGKPFIGSFILDESLVNKIIEGLEKAGLSVHHSILTVNR